MWVREKIHFTFTFSWRCKRYFIYLSPHFETREAKYGRRNRLPKTAAAAPDVFFPRSSALIEDGLAAVS